MIDTTEELYDKALESLQASNLMGLAKSLHEDFIPAARQDIKEGTAPCNRVSDHPAIILILDQMNQLRGGTRKFSWAYNAAKDKLDGREVTHYKETSLS